MTKVLLLFTLLCTCGPAQMLAQLTFSVNTGYSFGTFNQQPELIGDITFTRQGNYLDAINSATAGLEINYAPATTNLSWGLLLSYSRRGYEHFFKQDNGIQRRGNSFPSHVDYLDIIPRLTYLPGRLLSVSIGPYLSLGRKFEDNPFLVESERVTSTYDYGVNLEGRLHFGRTYVYTAYQRSFREYDYSSIEDYDFQPDGQILSIQEPSPISAIRVGIGYTIIR